MTAQAGTVDPTLLGALVGGGAAVLGNLLAGLVSGSTQKRQWRREQWAESHRAGIDAATDAGETLSRSNPEVLPLFGGPEAIQARIDDLMGRRERAHASLTRVIVSHPAEAVRQQAATLRHRLIIATNDAIAIAGAVIQQVQPPITIKEAVEAKQAADQAFESFVTLLSHSHSTWT